MASALRHLLADANAGVKLLLAGVALILAAQWFPSVPIAGAIALAAWGTILSAPRRRGVIAVTGVVYAMLGVYAIAAQVDLALDARLAWGWLAALDGAAAFTLLYSLLRQIGEMLAADPRR